MGDGMPPLTWIIYFVLVDYYGSTPRPCQDTEKNLRTIIVRKFLFLLLWVQSYNLVGTAFIHPDKFADQRFSCPCSR